MWLAQGHNAVTPVRLEPATPQYRDTEPLRSLDKDEYNKEFKCNTCTKEETKAVDLTY